MPAALTTREQGERRTMVLDAARWCFLNFGFAKTSLDDIARRANISRTLLYRTFRNKEAIFTAVFEHWLIARHPEAQLAASRPGRAHDRLIDVCRLLVLEPWADMATTPMGAEFYDVCARLDPEVEARHRKVALQCVTTVLGDKEAAEVFLLSLDGLFGDEPTARTLERRLHVLATHFVPPAGSKTMRRRS